jgi:ribosomal protein L11 methyltransferase
MRAQVLWRLSVLASEQAEEAIAELLKARFGQPASTYMDLERGTRTVTAFLEQKPDWSRAARRELRAVLHQIQGTGSGKAGATIRLTKLQPQNWAEAWKRHFKPLEIGASLLIKPSWSARRPRAGQATVVLDPDIRPQVFACENWRVSGNPTSLSHA